MISELKIGNFKAFGLPQTIPLRRITLVFGPNSAGKSSIIQSLLLARHIHDTGKPDAHQTTLGGTSVDLGGFARYVHLHQPERDTTIHLTFKRSEIREKFHYLDGFGELTLAYEIGLEESLAKSEREKAVIKAMTLILDGDHVVRMVQQNDGVFRLNEEAFKTHSFFAQYDIWSHSDIATHRALLDAARNLMSLSGDQLISIASKTGLPIDALRDPLNGKPSLKGCFAIQQHAMLQHRLGSEPIIRTDQDSVKAAVLKQLSDMEFRTDSLALENIGTLTVEHADYDTFASDAVIDNPRNDPFGFYSRYLSAPGEELSGSNLETAWAMALRYDLECLIGAASNAVQQCLNSMTYLGPLRCIPPRHMLETDGFVADWVAGGGDAWQRLRKDSAVVEKVNQLLRKTLRSRYTIRTRSFSRQLDAAALECCVRAAVEKAKAFAAGTEKEESLVASVAEDAPLAASKTPSVDMLAATLMAELSAQTSRETLTELQLFDGEAGIEVSHRDVGTGISQLLPVIVNAVASEGKLIAIEQPELHLHPALQAELGDVFIESALGENKNTFLIETHSEHLILRLLRRVRETTEGRLPGGCLALRPEDVCVLFVQPGKDGSTVLQLPVTLDGDFDQPWPGGFFAERAEELF